MLNTVNYFRKTFHHDIWQGSISKNITRDKYTLDRQYFDKYTLDRQYFDKYTLDRQKSSLSRSLVKFSDLDKEDFNTTLF